jgi:hypothetical protein
MRQDREAVVMLPAEEFERLTGRAQQPHSKFFAESPLAKASIDLERTRNDNLCQLILGAQDVDKIIRYGNAFERQMSRPYDRLERLQRLRKGEPVPPSMNVRPTR